MKGLKGMACGLAAAVFAFAAATGAEAGTGPEGEGWSVVNIGIGAQYWHVDELDAFDADGMFGMNLIMRIRPAKYLGIDLRLGGEGAWTGESIRINGRRYETDVTFSCVPVEAGLVLMLPAGDRVTLYGGGGVGYYFYDLRSEAYDDRYDYWYGRSRWSYEERIDMDGDVGWYALGGVSIQLCPSLSVFAEGRWTDSETGFRYPEDYDVSESDNEFDMSGFGIQAGLMFDF